MSSKAKHSPPEGAMSSGRLFAIRFFIITAIAIGFYLLWVSLGGMAVAGCGPASNCDKVLHSRWAYWFGLPVSAIALLVYIAVLLSSLRLGPTIPPVLQRQAWLVLVPCAVLIMGAAVWFTALQLFAIKVFCPFCMAAHGAGLAAAALLLFSAPFRQAPEKPWQIERQVFVPPALAKKVSLAALAGFAVLVAGQTLHQRKTFAVVSVPTNMMAQAQSNYGLPGRNEQEQTATNRPPQPATDPLMTLLHQRGKTKGLFQTHGGLFAFDLYDTPLIGSPEAPYAMLSLFDYTCHHCRIMHRYLMEAHRTFSNKLAIVSLPVPLDSACNPMVKITPSAHSNACEYARIGLALWRANPGVHAQFDDWVFAAETPPPLNEAKAYASVLAGKAAFDQALEERWVNDQITRSVAIYSTNSIHVGNSAMPQIIISNKLFSGTLTGVQELYRLLEENLGLKPGS